MKNYKKNKFKRLLKKIFLILPNFFGIIISPLIVFLIRILKPLILVRYGFIISTRIGHFVGNTDLYLSFRSLGLQDSDLFKKYNTLHIFYCQDDICNKFFYKKLKKKIIILPRFILHWVEQFDVFLDKFINSKRIHEIGCYDDIKGKDSFFSNKVPYLERDFNGHFENTQNFNLTEKEIKIGENILKELGYNQNKKIICLYARDNAYLNETYPNNDWSRHDYRNIDFKYFKKTANYLINNNFFVIRVGSLAEEKSDLDNDNFLDYPFSKHKSDFMDLFIAYKSHLLISSSSGIDDIYQSFRKPILWPTLFPIKDIKSSNKFHMSGFRHLQLKNGNKLTFKEVIKLNLDYCYNESLLRKENLSLCEPDEQEILDITKDMISLLSNNYILTQNEMYLEKKFFQIFNNSSFFKEYVRFHKKINFRVSKSFLKNNSWWLN